MQYKLKLVSAKLDVITPRENSHKDVSPSINCTRRPAIKLRPNRRQGRRGQCH